MKDLYENFGSGPPPLIWNRTGFPVIPENEPNLGIMYHLASRIEKYMCRRRPEDDLKYKNAVCDISSQLNKKSRIQGGKIISKFEKQKIANALPAFIRKRKTTRNFTGIQVSQEKLAMMLGMATAPRDKDPNIADFQEKRVVGSSGGLYPIDIYLLLWNVEKIPHGVYFFDVNEFGIRFISKSNVLKKMEVNQFSISDEELKKASGAIVLVFVNERIEWKYGNFSYTFGCLEAGHIMHALSLGASYTEIGLCPIGGFCHSEINKVIGLKENEEFSLYMCIFGS